MRPRTLQGAVRLALAAVAGIAASLALVTPASADDPTEPRAVSNYVNCAVNGTIFVLWHLEIPFPASVTNVQSVPSGELFFINGQPSPWPSYAEILQVLPGDVTTAGLTFTWTEVAHPEHTGTGAGTATQPIPACAPKVSAEFTPRCDRLVDVTLHNDLATSIVFLVNGAEHTVKGGTSAVVTGVAPAENGVVKVTADTFFRGLPVASATWTDPGGCATPTPSPNPMLAQTGSKVGGIVGVGAALLAAGALLVALSVGLRRRRARTGI